MPKHCRDRETGISSAYHSVYSVPPCENLFVCACPACPVAPEDGTGVKFFEENKCSEFNWGVSVAKKRARLSQPIIPSFQYSNIPRITAMRSLTIKQVSRRLNLTTHTLRFWEKELEGILTPLRTEGGQRRYTPEHLFLIEEIKRLKQKGLSLIDIKDKLGNSYNSAGENSNSDKIDILANQIAEIVRTAIHRFFETETVDQ